MVKGGVAGKERRSNLSNDNLQQRHDKYKLYIRRHNTLNETTKRHTKVPNLFLNEAIPILLHEKWGL